MFKYVIFDLLCSSNTSVLCLQPSPLLWFVRWWRVRPQRELVLPSLSWAHLAAWECSCSKGWPWWMFFQTCHHCTWGTERKPSWPSAQACEPLGTMWQPGRKQAAKQAETLSCPQERLRSQQKHISFSHSPDGHGPCAWCHQKAD